MENKKLLNVEELKSVSGGAVVFLPSQEVLDTVMEHYQFGEYLIPPVSFLLRPPRADS